jgi:hypothetical protein
LNKEGGIGNEEGGRNAQSMINAQCSMKVEKASGIGGDAV